MKRLPFLAATFFLLGLDRWTKVISLGFESGYLGWGLAIKYSQNYSLSLNLLGPGIFMKFGILIALIYLLYYFEYSAGWVFITAGALGNLYDRVVLGYVVDFIQFVPVGFIFNLADFFIYWGIFLQEYKNVWNLLRTAVSK